MKNITIAALEGCTLCSALIEELKVRGVIFNVVYAEQDPSLCDSIEALVQTNHYPIVIIKREDKIDAYYVTSRSTELGTRYLPSEVTVHAFASVHSLLSAI